MVVLCSRRAASMIQLPLVELELLPVVAELCGSLMATAEAAPSTPPRGTPSRRGKSHSPREAQAPRELGAFNRTADDFVKPFATLVSALDVPTDGSDPAYDFRKPPKESEHDDRDDEHPSEPKRAPRKSKTEAMAALARGDSPGLAAQDAPAGVPQHTLGPPPATKLDFSAIKTSSPRVLPPRTHPRPFGLEDCPAFYPSMEEFKDPTKYMQSIAPKAQEYGLCKIVPPVGWKMPFVTDTEVRRHIRRVATTRGSHACRPFVSPPDSSV